MRRSSGAEWRTRGRAALAAARRPGARRCRRADPSEACARAPAEASAATASTSSTSSSPRDAACRGVPRDGAQPHPADEGAARIDHPPVRREPPARGGAVREHARLGRQERTASAGRPHEKIHRGQRVSRGKRRSKGVGARLSVGPVGRGDHRADDQLPGHVLRQERERAVRRDVDQRLAARRVQDAAGLRPSAAADPRQGPKQEDLVRAHPVDRIEHAVGRRRDADRMALPELPDRSELVQARRGAADSLIRSGESGSDHRDEEAGGGDRRGTSPCRHSQPARRPNEERETDRRGDEPRVDDRGPPHRASRASALSVTVQRGRGPTRRLALVRSGLISLPDWTGPRRG